MDLGTFPARGAVPSTGRFVGKTFGIALAGAAGRLSVIVILAAIYGSDERR